MEEEESLVDDRTLGELLEKLTPLLCATTQDK
jgi:hypothetical protein